MPQLYPQDEFRGFFEVFILRLVISFVALLPPIIYKKNPPCTKKPTIYTKNPPYKKPTCSNAYAKIEQYFSIFSSKEIGSSLVSLEMIFDVLRSELKLPEFNLHIVYMNYVVTQMIFIKISKSNKFCVIANKFNFIFSISILPGHEYVTVLITWLTRDCDFSQSRNTIVRYRIY